ncbi:MAG: hypothetical protein QOJ89_3685 [bacterium]|jgi:hypothetical protein
MDSTSGSRLQRAVALVAAAVLVAFGIASIIKGLDGRSTVNSSLKQERVKGEPFMSPAGIVARAKALGFTDFKAPDCSVANKAITTGSDARCFAQYMRIDALVATGGKTYADMPSFVGKDGKLTDDIAKAKIVPGTGIVPNPARALWVTETALTTALNASYMGDQISLFGIGVGAVMLLLGLVLGGVSLGGVRIGQSEASRARTLSRT